MRILGTPSESSFSVELAIAAPLIFRARDRSVPEAFALHDPYVTNGLEDRPDLTHER